MKTEIIAQYQASLKMLMDTITKCPDDVWVDETYENAYWRIVYHALFYTAFYLSPKEELFVHWPKHIADYENLGALNDDNLPIVITGIYSKAEMLGYSEDIINSLDRFISDTDDKKESGFDWLRINKLQMHLYNIRHTQHHVGQLIERLHQRGIKGINWVR